MTRLMSEAAIANSKFLSDKMNLLKFQIQSSKNRSNLRVPLLVIYEKHWIHIHAYY